MKILLTITILVLSLDSFGQEIENLEGKWYADRIRYKTAEMKPFRVDKEAVFNIKEEGKTYTWHREDYIVSADLIVGNDSLTDITNTEARLRTDTLDILIYQTDESHDHNFQIQILKDRCFIFYDYSYPMDEKDRKVKTIEFALTLNTKTFVKGKFIRGHVSYVGRCVSYCDLYGDKDVKIDGDFVVMVK
jgi:hypothetical protein